MLPHKQPPLQRWQQQRWQQQRWQQRSGGGSTRRERVGRRWQAEGRDAPISFMVAIIAANPLRPSTFRRSSGSPALNTRRPPRITCLGLGVAIAAPSLLRLLGGRSRASLQELGPAAKRVSDEKSRAPRSGGMELNAVQAWQCFHLCSPRPSATAIAVFTPGVATVQPRRFLRIVSRVGAGRRTRIAHASSAKTAPHTPAKIQGDDSPGTGVQGMVFWFAGRASLQRACGQAAESRALFLLGLSRVEKYSRQAIHRAHRPFAGGSTTRAGPIAQRGGTRADIAQRGGIHHAGPRRGGAARARG